MTSGSVRCVPDFTSLCSDVTVLADGVEIPAHRAVLSSASPYFKAKLSGETKSNAVVVEQVAAPVLKEVIRFCYTERCNMRSSAIEDTAVPTTPVFQLLLKKTTCKESPLPPVYIFAAMLLSEAERFQLPQLEMLCVEELCKTMADHPTQNLVLAYEAKSAVLKVKKRPWLSIDRLAVPRV